MEKRNEIKPANMGTELLQARFHEQLWSSWSEEKTDQVLAKLELGLMKLAQHLDLEVVDEEGYLI